MNKKGHMIKERISLLILLACLIAPGLPLSVMGGLHDDPGGEVEPYKKTGILHVRFDDSVGDRLEAESFAVDQRGIVVTGIAEVDALNGRYHVTDMHLLFRGLGQDGRDGFSDRHRERGLHLWYVIRMDERADVGRMAEEYSRTSSVRIAEPVLKTTQFAQMVYCGDPGAEAIQMPEGQEPGSRGPSLPDDPFFGNQWYLQNTGNGGTEGADIGFAGAWELEKGNPEVIVAIVDGGIEYNHPDIEANMWSGIGYNFRQNISTIYPQTHATMVAGIVGAATNNDLGISGIAGGSGSGTDGVRLMTCMVYSPQGFGSGFESAHIWAADNGAAIAQNSWGYVNPGVYQQSVLDAIDYFNDFGGGDVMAGGLVVFAAGNRGDESEIYPARYEGTVAVAASDRNDRRAPYSVYGHWIDLTAPGGEESPVSAGIYSTKLVDEGKYGYHYGTSYSTPMVSGVAALILSRAPGVFTASRVLDIMKETADDIDELNPDYSEKLGAGRVNALAAIEHVDAVLGMNPQNIRAVAETDISIRVSWEKNTEGHQVLLALVPDKSYPVPEGTYQVGEAIGPGEVLYVGDGEFFVHEDLIPGSDYSYRLWSYDHGKGSYSEGQSVSGRTVPPPVNLVAGKSGDDAQLDWSPPASWLSFDQSTDDAFPFGHIEGDDFIAAKRFSSSYLLAVNAIGRELTKISIHPTAPPQDYITSPDFTLLIWHLDDGVEAVPLDADDQPITTGLTMNAWNTIDLDQPVEIEEGKALWIGYEAKGGEPLWFPVGADHGPASPGSGDLLYYDGQWHSTRSYLGLDRNFLLRGYLEGSPGNGKGRSESGVRGSMGSHVLAGYKVYRNGEVIEEINDPAQTSFTDPEPGMGEFHYHVTAVYANPESESGPSNVETLTFD